MASDATAQQIENRGKVFFWAVVVFLILVIIALIGAIAKNTVTPEKTEADYAAEVVAQGNTERATFPIVSHLPVKNSLFTLGYQFSNQGQSLTLKVTTTETYLDSAIEKLRGFNEDLTGCSLDLISLSDGSPLANPFLSAYVVNNEDDPILALRSAYARVDNFQVVRYIPVYEQGNTTDLSKALYFLATITTGSAASYNLQTYRVVLTRNSDNLWTPVANPAPLVNVYNTPNIPVEYLKQLNNL